MQDVKYPALKLLLEERFEVWKGVHPRQPSSIRELAKAITKKTGETITFSSLYDWLSGKAKPHRDKITALVRFLTDEPADQQILTNALFSAISIPKSIVDPMEIVESKERRLNIGVIHFPGFCELIDEKPNGFLDRLVNYFLSFAGLEGKTRASFREIPIDQVEQFLCETGAYDLVLGLFVDPSRTRQLWFYHELPILIPLNAVCARRPEDPRSLFAEMTMPNNQGLKERICPIIDPHELGGIYTRQFLGIDSEACIPVDYDLSRFAETLVNRSVSEHEDRLPVCIVDEVSCCRIRQVARAMIDRLPPSKNGPQAEHVTLIASPRHSSVPLAERHYFPRYRYGMAIANRNSRWFRHFAEAFELFLESNTELVSQLYFNLYCDLKKLYKNEDIDRIKDWLSLSRDGMPSKDGKPRMSETWKEIISQADFAIQQMESPKHKNTKKPSKKGPKSL